MSRHAPALPVWRWQQLQGTQHFPTVQLHAGYRETSGVGRRPVLTPDEVLRLPIEEALVIVRGKKVLRVHKMDYSLHPAYRELHSCKASAHVPAWRAALKAGGEESDRTAGPLPQTPPSLPPGKPGKRVPPRRKSPAKTSDIETSAPKPPTDGVIAIDKIPFSSNHNTMEVSLWNCTTD